MLEQMTLNTLKQKMLLDEAHFPALFIYSLIIIIYVYMYIFYITLNLIFLNLHILYYIITKFINILLGGNICLFNALKNKIWYQIHIDIAIVVFFLTYLVTLSKGNIFE